MESHQSTTPFGRRPFSLAMMASQSISKECPHGIAVHKWQVFRAICEGRTLLGVSERALSVLNALLTFHPESIMTGEGDLIVFPSNQQLSLRAHGMAPATLRRHLAVLVDCGIVIRRDSPNGKRYARKDKDGEIEKAFGFDLTPFVARAAEFEQAAESVRVERRSVHLFRERITLARRDVVKMICTAREEGIPGDWAGRHAVYGAIMDRLPRTADSAILAPIVADLETLVQEIRSVLESHVNSKNKSAKESQTERHIQNSKTTIPPELEPVHQEGRGAKGPTQVAGPRPPARPFPLALVIQACPDIVDYVRGGISHWSDLVTAAALARGALGISPSAYEDAQEVLGDETAAVTVAAILQKGDAVLNAGAYLRGLTAKGRKDGFSPGPMLMALLRARQQPRRRA